VIVDYHLHLRDEEGRVDFSRSAAERFVQTAARQGVDEIGFSEHVYYFRQTGEVWNIPYQLERCVHDLDAYCDAVLEAKAAGLPVKLGLEVDYVGPAQGRLADLLAAHPFDFLLGSVHWLDGLAVDQEPGIWSKLSLEDVWRRYVDALC
jgi:histidinol-phosphatase (PHP family)